MAKYRGGRAAATLSDESITAHRGTRVSAETFALTPATPPPSASRRASAQLAMKLEAPSALAAGLSRRRLSFEENVKAHGNAKGRPVRSPLVRIELTPWCHIDVEPAKLGQMTEDTPDILGAALTYALHEERIQEGKWP